MRFSASEESGLNHTQIDAPLEAGQSAGTPSPRRTASVWLTAAAILCFTGIAVILQFAAGAYRAELSSYPDESAQAVAGVALERYVLHGLSHAPWTYMREYYLHYPKVAIGHWPPLLYVAEAAAILVSSPSKYALLGLEACLAGLLAWLVFRELQPLVGWAAAALGGVALLANRVIQQSSSMTMAELLLTVTMFLACLAFGRFAESRRAADAMWFAIWTSAAVMTKGTGWALGLVVIAVIVLTRDWELPFTRALRPAALVVAVCCVPWQLATMKSVENGWYDKPSVALASQLAARYCVYLFTVPGILIAISGLAGAVYVLRGKWKLGRSQAYWAALTGLVAAAWLFNIIAPTSEEERKVIMIVPPLFVLAAAGVSGLAERISPYRQKRFAGLLFSAIAVISLAMSLPLRAKPRFGFDDVAADLAGSMPPKSAMLVVSDSFGEGALISEFVLRKPDPSVYLMRGSKLLASQTWNEYNYSNRINSDEECVNLLASVPVSFLVVDRRRALLREPYFNFVDSMLRTHPAEWQLVREYASPGDSPKALALYRWSGGVQPVNHLPDWLLPKIPGLR